MSRLVRGERDSRGAVSSGAPGCRHAPRADAELQWHPRTHVLLARSSPASELEFGEPEQCERSTCSLWERTSAADPSCTLLCCKGTDTSLRRTTSLASHPQK